MSALEAYAEAKLLPVEFLRELGLRDVEVKGRPALAIPYRDQDGAEVAVRYRTSTNGSGRFRLGGQSVR